MTSIALGRFLHPEACAGAAQGQREQSRQSLAMMLRDEAVE
jgi:hypothetical protein